MKRLLFSALLCVFTVTACDSVLDREPQQSVSAEIALTNQTGYEAVLNSIYDDLQDESHYGQDFILYPEVLSDNALNTAANSNRYPNVEDNQRGSQLNRWGGHYSAINKANNIIANVGNLAAEQGIRNRFLGEAYFLRALNYFDLARTKGYEPGREVNGFNLSAVIRTEPTRTLEQADFIPRATNTEVYALIKSDFQEAARLLVNETNPRRANSAAALALLARVHLYASEWAEAQQRATEALAAAGSVGAGLVARDGYVAGFTDSTHPEALFKVDMEPNRDGGVTGFNESLSSLTYPTTPPDDNLARWGDIYVSDDLYNMYEADDIRGLTATVTGGALTSNGLWLIATKSGQQYRYSRKWVGARTPYAHDIPVIRVSELYLIRAEAAARQGNSSQALTDLNVIRSRAGIDDEDSSLSGDGLISSIMKERRLEFAFEGHRFFDLKRTANPISKALGRPSIAYSDFRVLAQIPQTQVESAPLTDPDNVEGPRVLIQNPGY